MSLILDLRGRLSHAGIPLVHPTSEHVVLANVFGIIKNLSPDVAINPWLQSVTKNEDLCANSWSHCFWEKQERPIGILGEGNTEVDLVLKSDNWIVFVEVKMDAEASQNTKNDPERNQLVRNLDVGFCRASHEKKGFSLIYVTPDESQPDIVAKIRSQKWRFPANAEVDSPTISKCLSWSPWSIIGDVVASSYINQAMDAVERKFALDLLAYLCLKRLWNSSLPDDPIFYLDKLYRPLRKSDSRFVPYSHTKGYRYQGWRTKPWEESTLRTFLSGLRVEDKALLKLLADAGGALQQRTIMEKLPFLKGRSSRSLTALKSHLNAGCRQLDCAQILSEGTGLGDYRVHQINPGLGELRQIVIEIARKFEIQWHLLEKAEPKGN